MSAHTSVRVESFGTRTSIIEEDECWGFSTDEVCVTFSNDAWWVFIEAMQEWLGECRHCGKPTASHPEVAA